MERFEALRLTGPLFGRDGEGEGGSSDDPEAKAKEEAAAKAKAAEEGKKPDDTDPLAGKDGDKDEFDREYVEKLRAENAKYRTRAKANQDKLDEIEREQMSDLEKSQADGKAETARADKAEEELAGERLANFVRAQASDFIDPQDAVDRMDMKSIRTNNDGTPDKGSVKSLLDAIAKDKPYLLKSANSGSGDGGTRGVSEKDQSDADKVNAQRKSLVDAGAVPIPLDNI